MADQDRQEAFQLTDKQVQTIAAGLYQLASCDGHDEHGKEIQLIQEFLDETGHPDLIDRLPDLPFDPASAFQVLDSSWLRKIFLEAALLIIQADGTVSESERETLEWMAMAFGVAGGYDEIAAQVQGASL